MTRFKTFFRSRDGIFAGLLAAGILLRAEYWREFSHSPLFPFALGADVSEYWARAQAILHGGFWAGQPDIHAPLYSLFLALECLLTGSDIPVIRGIQLGLGVLAWCGFYAFLRFRCAPPENRVPEWVFAGGMLYTPLIFFQAELVSESLLLLLLPGVLACMMALQDEPEENRRSMLLSSGGGVLTGLAVITHPMTLLYFALQTVVLLCGKKRLRAVWFVLAGALVILPVSVTRSLAAGRPVLVQSNSAFNLYLGNNPHADGTCNLRPGTQWKTFHRQVWQEAADKQCTQDEILLKRTLDFVFSSPLSALKLLGKKALLVWVPGELPSGADMPPVFGWTPLVRYTAPFASALLLVLGLAGLYPVLRHPEKRERWAVPLLLTGAFYLAQILFVTSGRYRLAMLPGLLILAGCFMQWRPRCYREKVFAAGAGCLLAAGAAFLAPPVRGLAESRTLFAEALYRQGRPLAVQTLLAGTAAHSNDPARDWCMLGMAETMLGNRAEAERLFRLAADAAPAEAEGMMNLGILSSEAGRLTEAASLLAQAEKREPEHPGTLYNYAVVLEKLKRYNEAADRLQKLLALDPCHGRGWNALGRVRFMNRDLAGAEDAFLRALALAPGSEGLKRNLEIVRKQRQAR